MVKSAMYASGGSGLDSQYHMAAHIGSPKKLVLLSEKECCSGSVDGLISKSEGKQAKAKVPCFVSFYINCYQKVKMIFLI